MCVCLRDTVAACGQVHAVVGGPPSKTFTDTTRRERTWFLMESSGDPMNHLKEEEAKHLPSFWDFEEVKQWGLQLRGASGRRW